MKLLIVGVGAVGSWLGGHLVAGGADVLLVARGHHGAALAAVGLLVRTARRTFSVHAPVIDHVAAAARHGPFDGAIVTVKGYHTAEVAAELATLTRSGALAGVASFQNGVGNEALLAAALPGLPVWAATLTTGVEVGPPGTVTGSGKGGVGLSANLAADSLAATLTAGGLEVRRYEDEAAMKWSKLLLNLQGSASSALLEWPPARVFSQERLFRLELDAWRETLAVLRAAGLAVVDLPGYPVRSLALAARLVPPPLLFRVASRRLGAGRGDRLPGLAADLAAGRTASEVTLLHGAVADHGRRLGVPTPVCQALTDLVLATSAGTLDRGTMADRPAALLRAVYGGGQEPGAGPAKHAAPHEPGVPDREDA